MRFLDISFQNRHSFVEPLQMVIYLLRVSSGELGPCAAKVVIGFVDREVHIPFVLVLLFHLVDVLSFLLGESLCVLHEFVQNAF